MTPVDPKNAIFSIFFPERSKILNLATNIIVSAKYVMTPKGARSASTLLGEDMSVLKVRERNIAINPIEDPPQDKEKDLEMIIWIVQSMNNINAETSSNIHLLVS